MSETNKHALLSPSGAAGWMVCAGKPAMERGLPDDSNEHSRYGTRAHDVAADCLELGIKPSDYLIDAPEDSIVDQEMVDGVQVYVDMVKKRIADYKLAGAVSVEMMVEQRVPIGHITGEEGAEGTADVVIIVMWSDGTALIDVIDLKFGMGVAVFAENNPQGMLYALGAVEKFSCVTDFDRVRICIHQPRLSETPSDWEIGIGELMAFGKTASERAYHALQVYQNEKPDALIHHLTAGDHCRKAFCKARATCPKLAQFVEDTIGADFEVMAGGVAAIPPGPASIATKFKAIGIIEDWCKAVRAKAEALLFEHGNSPEIIEELGVKLVQGKQGNRAWSSSTEAEAMLKSMRLKQEEMYDFSLISPTTAEKVLKGTPKRWKRIEPLITRSPGKPSVADASDKRPALDIKPTADDFEEVETQPKEQEV